MMKKNFTKIVAFTAMLTAFSIASCSREGFSAPDIESSQELEATEHEFSNEPGIEILFESDLRSEKDKPIIGFKDENKPVVTNMKRFYSWRVLIDDDKKIKFSLDADQNIYIKSLNYRIFSHKNPTINLVQQQNSIEKVQLKDERAKVYQGILKIPNELDVNQSYSLRLHLNGGQFEEVPNKFSDPTDIFSLVGDPRIGTSSLRSWIREVIDQLKSAYRVGDDGAVIGQLEEIETKLLDYSVQYDLHPNYSKMLVNEYFTLTNTSYPLQAIGQTGVRYSQQWNDWMDEANSGDEEMGEYADLLLSTFFNIEGFSAAMAIYDLDGSKSPESLIKLYQANSKAILKAHFEKIQELKKIIDTLQDITVNVKWTSRNWQYTSHSPFRSQAEGIYKPFPVDRSARMELRALNSEIQKKKEVFIQYYHHVNSLLPSNQKMIWHENPEWENYFNPTYNFIKMRLGWPQFLAPDNLREVEP